MLERDIYSAAEQLLTQLYSLILESEQQRRGMRYSTRALESEVTGMLEPIRLLLTASKTAFHKKYAKYVGNERIETLEETVARVVKETELRTKSEL